MKNFSVGSTQLCGIHSAVYPVISMYSLNTYYAQDSVLRLSAGGEAAR